MDRVLVIEDSSEFQIMLRSALAPTYEFEIVGSLAAARLQLAKPWQAIILDLTLPDGPGFELLPEIEASNSKNAALLILTAADDIQLKSKAFVSGADDYITKPFTLEELRIRLDARLKKNKLQIQNREEFYAHDFKINYQMHKIYFVSNSESTDLGLTPNEFKVMNFFIKNMDQTFSRKQLLKIIWSDHLHVTERTIDTHIAHLRKKIPQSSLSIQSVPGEGYRCFAKAEVRA